MMKFLAVVVVLAAVLVANFTFFANRNPIPAHLMGHHLVDRENFLSPQLIEEMLEATRNVGPIYSTTKEPAVFQDANTEDNIGEAIPAVKDPKTGDMTCPGHRLLALDNTGKRCVLPGRVDVGRHYIMTGGPEAKKESRETLVSRVQPFLHYITDYKKDKMAKKLLESEEMVKFSKDVCPPGKKLLDPVSLNWVVNAPGNTVATHLDAVYFRRASRFHIPQWLGAVMMFSGLFKDEFVDQVQIVAYYHKWKDYEYRKGNFFFWNRPGAPEISKPISGSANSVDGSKVVHAAAVYMPWRKPPVLPRVARNIVEYRKGSLEKEGKRMWDIKSNDKTVASYEEDELRFSAVYRCRCFKDEADLKLYREQQKPGESWNVTYVLDILRRDMAANGVAPMEKTAAMPRVDLAELLLKTYIKYPLSPDAAMPYNFCAVTEIESLSFLKPYLASFCP